MDEFEKFVEECWKNKENRTISNASITHAKILFRYLLKDASKEKPIRIVSGCLDRGFYGDLSETILSVMNKGAEIKVIMLCEEAKILENEVAKTIGSHSNGEIRYMNPEQENLPHYILVGDNEYRIEMDDDTKEARANFNDTMVGRFLKNWHERTWQNAKEVKFSAS